MKRSGDTDCTHPYRSRTRKANGFELTLLTRLKNSEQECNDLMSSIAGICNDMFMFFTVKR